MKKQIFGILAVAGILALAALAAQAQDATAVVKVPFQFVVSGTVLPAGSYRVVPDAADPNLLKLYDVSGKIGVPIVTDFGGDVSGADQATFGFRKVGGYYFLSEIRLPGADDRVVPLTTKSITTQLAKLQAPADRAVSGGTQH